MKFDLVRPCPHCPFRMDVPPYLRRAQEIASSLAGGSTFACHQTTATVEDDEGDDDVVATPDSQMCAGAMIALMRSGGPNQIMRVAERTRGLDVGKLDMTAPVGSLVEFVAHHDEEDDESANEACSVANPGCLHPAGELVEGTVVAAAEKEPTSGCPSCGEPVCDACRDGDECFYCAERKREREAA